MFMKIHVPTIQCKIKISSKNSSVCQIFSAYNFWNFSLYYTFERAVVKHIQWTCIQTYILTNILLFLVFRSSQPILDLCWGYLIFYYKYLITHMILQMRHQTLWKIKVNDTEKINLFISYWKKLFITLIFFSASSSSLISISYREIRVISARH